MSLGHYLFFALIAIILLRAISNYWNLLRSLKWLRTDIKNDIMAIDISKSAHFYICIPVLNEQEIIITTLERFFAQDYPSELFDIYIATTDKENLEPGKMTTREIVERYQKTLSKNLRKKLHIVHFPSKYGRMSHQINYVAEKLGVLLSEDNAYFVIYNADSNIAANTLSTINYEIVHLRESIGRYPKILQQSAIYQYKGKSAIAEGAGVHQSLWTLMHEIPHLRQQSAKTLLLNTKSSKLEILRYSRIAHCVGHGLYVQGKHYLKYPLPQGVLNEDLPYGLMMCAMRIPIYSIPMLELALTPNKLKNVYKQKSVWFNPFFEFYLYASRMRRDGIGHSNFEIIYLTLQAYLHLCIWLVHSGVLLTSLFLSTLYGLEYFAIWCFAIILYWLLPGIILLYSRRSLINGGSHSLASLFFGLPYILTHSIGPIICNVRWVKAMLLQATPSKPKTENN